MQTRVSYTDKPLTQEDLIKCIARVPDKFVWFRDRGYMPHYYQIMFHSFWNPVTDKLCRYRHLVAGRRGGKTLSAAWDLTYYMQNPHAFHRDAHGIDSDKPLHAWILTPDYRSSGRASLFTMREVLRAAGLGPSDFQENRGEKWIEFENGSMIEFKTAERPEQLVGAGLDILWLDEAAIIPDEDAWLVARPALSNKQGHVIATTTPRGKNWYYDLFWNTNAIKDPNIASVEYRSIDNKFFPRDEWYEVQHMYHPMFFKREYMASFDAFSGIELSGDWLSYYETKELPREDDGTLALDLYVGVDPAVSLMHDADRFVMTLLGVDRKMGQVYLLEQFADRIPFPEQVQKIDEWFRKYRPTQIAVESTAYQASLAQATVQLPGMPPIVPVYAQGKKSERILAMSTLFKAGKVKIRQDHVNFVDEWINYNSELKNPRDDCLDSMEIALRAANVLLPEPVEAEQIQPAFDVEASYSSAQQLANAEIEALKQINAEYDDPDWWLSEGLGDDL